MCTPGGCLRLGVHSFGAGRMKLKGSSPSRAHARFWVVNVHVSGSASMQHHRDATPRRVGTLPDFRVSFFFSPEIFRTMVVGALEFGAFLGAALTLWMPSAPPGRSTLHGVCFRNPSPHAKIPPFFVIDRSKRGRYRPLAPGRCPEFRRFLDDLRR